MERALSADLERVASSTSVLSAAAAFFHVTVTTETDVKELAVRPSEVIFDAIATGLGCHVSQIDEITLGDEGIQNGESFEDHGICEGARLTVSIRARATVVEVAEELIRGTTTPIIISVFYV